jgi:hypothetical protein
MSLTLFALIVSAISVSKNGDPKVLEVAIADLTVLKSNDSNLDKPVPQMELKSPYFAV